MDRSRKEGFTLFELLVVIAISAILAMIAAPSFLDTLDRYRLTTAAESIAAQLRWARSEAIKTSRDTYVSFAGTDSSAWCLGIDDVAVCDCTKQSDCQVGKTNKVYPQGGLATVAATRPRLAGVTFSGTPTTHFDPVRGMATAGHIHLVSARGFELDVILSPLGLTRLCSPSGGGHVPGYAAEC